MAANAVADRQPRKPADYRCVGCDELVVEGEHYIAALIELRTRLSKELDEMLVKSNAPSSPCSPTIRTA